MDRTPSRVELSPLGFLHRNAQALGHRPAVVHGERRLTCTELAERRNRLACALRNRGQFMLGGKEWEGREKAIG
jgi:non-ribosomal peptide synthetase component E (peptide arylation enzyme)